MLNKYIGMSNYINKKEICIYASELSNLIGVSFFKPQAETLHRLWKTNFPEDFKNTKKILEKKNKKVKEKESNEEVFDKFKKNLSKEKKKEVCVNMDKCMEAKEVNSMINQRRELLKECEMLPTKEKKQIEKSIIEMTNTNFGTKNEDKSIHIYTQMTGLPVIRINKFFKKLIIKSNDYSWFLGGRIDGILENRTIIEIKNRMHKLFNKVKDYEKVQTYSYMYILETNKSEIVETYMNGKVPEASMLEVNFEEPFWEFILNRILVFIDYFNRFINSNKLKQKLLSEGIDDFEMDLFKM